MYGIHFSRKHLNALRDQSSSSNAFGAGGDLGTVSQRLLTSSIAGWSPADWTWCSPRTTSLVESASTPCGRTDNSQCVYPSHSLPALAHRRQSGRRSSHFTFRFLLTSLGSARIARSGVQLPACDAISTSLRGRQPAHTLWGHSLINGAT